MTLAARLAPNRLLRAAALLSVALCSLLYVAATGTAFAAAAAVVDQPKMTSEKAGQRAPGRRGGRRQEGFTLLLGTGRPGVRRVPVGSRKLLASCIVESSPGAKGPGEALQVLGQRALETWVMRGDPEVVRAFTLWRRVKALTEGTSTSLRCTATHQVSTDDLRCLECVSAAPASETLLGWDTSQCLAWTARRAGYCKTGALRI